MKIKFDETPVIQVPVTSDKPYERGMGLAVFTCGKVLVGQVRAGGDFDLDIDIEVPTVGIGKLKCVVWYA